MAQTTTTCGPEFGKWVCHSTAQAQPPPNIVGAGMRAYDDATARSRQMQQDRADAMAAQNAAAQQEEANRVAAHRQFVQQAVANAVREHRCADAKDLALGEADLTMADQVQRLCQ